MTESMLEELASYVASKPPQKVETVFIGQAFTVVKLASGHVGLALTPLTRFDSCIGATRLAGKLTRHNASELAKFLSSGHSHLRAIGLATVNAVLQRELQERSDYVVGDFMEFLKVKPDENVAMIDYYTTKIEFLRFSNLMIFDNRFASRRKDISIFPMSEIPKRFGQVDVVILPPTFMDRIDEFRKRALEARAFVLAHPTTPPLPEPFFARGVTMVASMMIIDPDSVFRHIMEGAGTTLFKSFCRKIAFLRN